MPKTDLIATLMPELFQTERSAQRHPMVEARRFSDTPLADPMRAVSQHATSVLPEWERLARARGLTVSRSLKSIGRLFSTLRDRFADRLVDSERSYRGTLLGIRHGVDLVRLLNAAAQAQGDAELARFCMEWLQTRVALTKDVAAQLGWLAEHPERARPSESLTRCPLAKWHRAIAPAPEHRRCSQSAV